MCDLIQNWTVLEQNVATICGYLHKSKSRLCLIMSLFSIILVQYAEKVKNNNDQLQVRTHRPIQNHIDVKNCYQIFSIYRYIIANHWKWYGQLHANVKWPELIDVTVKLSPVIHLKAYIFLSCPPFLLVLNLLAEL